MIWRLRWLCLLLLLGWSGISARLVGGANSNQSSLHLTFQRSIDFGPWDLVTALAWSPDGQLLAVAAGDAIHIFRSLDWTESSMVRVGAFTHGLAFSPDGEYLAAGSRDGNLRLWRTSPGLRLDGESVFLISLAHRKGVNSVSFSPDGTMLASGGNDAIARFWNPDDGELLGMTIGGTFAVPSVDFSPGGEFLAIVNGSVVRLRHPGAERILGTFQAEVPLYDVTFSPDGKNLAATGSDNKIRLWKTEDAYKTGSTSFPISLTLEGHQGAENTFRALIWQVEFNPDNKLLVSAGGDGTIRLWDTVTSNQLESYAAHSPGVTSIAFNPAGDLLASGGLDGRLAIWELSR